MLPKDADMTKWSCVACDQFTSEPEYWREAESIVGDAPSTLRMMLPEAYLDSCDRDAETRKIYAAMNDYVNRGIFRTVPDSFVYLERTTSGGALRRGLIGKLDLECYDWAPGTATPVRATEGTVESRLPPRVKVRAGAPLEMPHIMVFIDDPGDTVIPSAAGGEALYDFDLMLGGGHVRGSRVCGEHAERVSAAVDALDCGGMKFAMGDGNHSLAAAKRCWESVKAGLPETEWEAAPARYALVELVNIHDSAVTFAPIHRVVSGTSPERFLAEAEKAFPEGKTGLKVSVLTADGQRDFTADGMTLGALVSRSDELCKLYTERFSGSVDYVHGDAEAAGLGSRPGCAAILLPELSKSDLFPEVAANGPYPKKSFSVGEARDKRYYLECRKIK